MRYKPFWMTQKHGITRRDFLWLSSMATAGLMVGCATNPVTGKSQFMLLSEADEIKLDQQNSLIQFSADYGPVQDQKLNGYINRTGKNLAKQT
ncbi:MAG: twin-arginine translocation signal domain-containing protein, partial [Desulfobacteraceae bacterium]|nr:twin-arginine translocation signal domain-containing protein [Desulfobacteraceae bacterium]